jgi:hypothetical protein
MVFTDHISYAFKSVQNDFSECSTSVPSTNYAPSTNYTIINPYHLRKVNHSDFDCGQV